MNRGISVIVPNYNYAQFIPEAVESIAAQNYRPLEIIVVDDCSTDHSAEVLGKMEKRDYGADVLFRTIMLPKNGGVSNTRNEGAKVATYDYICFMDVDDRFYNPEKLSNEMALVEKYADRGEDIIAYSRIVYMDYEGNVNGNQGTKASRYMQGNVKYYLISGFKAARLPRDYVLKKSIFEKVAGYENIFYEDLDILLKLAFECRFFCTQEWGTIYRRFPAGISARPYEEHLAMRKKLCNKYYAHLSFFQKRKCDVYKILHALRNFIRRIKGEKIR